MLRTLTRKQLIFDVVAALVVWLIFSPVSLYPLVWEAGSGATEIDWSAVTVSILMAAALGLRRLSPALALTIAWVGAIVQMLFGLPPMAINFAIFGVLYATAAYGSPRVRRLGLV